MLPKAVISSPLTTCYLQACNRHIWIPVQMVSILNFSLQLVTFVNDERSKYQVYPEGREPHSWSTYMCGLEPRHSV